MFSISPMKASLVLNVVAPMPHCFNLTHHCATQFSSSFFPYTSENIFILFACFLPSSNTTLWLSTVMLVTSKFQRGNSYTLHSACNFGHKHYIPIDGGGRIHTTIRPLMLN
ncbi:hypothetical protein AAZX31_14G172600 [Glycine max]